MQNSINLSNVNFLSVEIKIYGDVMEEAMGTINLGSITLGKQGRDYKQDVVKSEWTYETHTGFTNIRCHLEQDENELREFFDDSNFNLEAIDLHDKLDVATMFLGDSEYEGEMESITLFVKFMNDDGTGMTKAIELTEE